MQSGEVDAAQESLMRFVRNFGLHQPDRTPCGQPLPVSEAHAMVEIAREGRIRQVELARRLRLGRAPSAAWSPTWSAGADVVIKPVGRVNSVRVREGLVNPQMWASVHPGHRHGAA
jgi:hypothetical protein